MTASDTYFIISSPSEGMYKEKGSKFIAVAIPVFSEDEVKEQLLNIRKKYFDARHHCYAYVLGADKKNFRSNDDGEPSGSAGKPILNQIYSAELTNILVVVVRYFGGIKLGVSGLVNAYKTAAREALQVATIVECTVDDVYSIHFTYPLMNDVMRILKEEMLQPTLTRFEIECYLELRCRKTQVNRVVERFSQIYGVNVNFLYSI
jgi:uncharacterized YigZ family protein